MLASKDADDPHGVGPIRVTHLRIDAESQRALARQRGRAARLALPVFAGLTIAVVVISLKLMLLAVVSGFMTYACVVVARQADRAGRVASDQMLTLSGDTLEGPPARRVQTAVVRRDYVRLLLGDGSAPSSLDVPLTAPQRETLAEALRSVGVRVEIESPLRRALTLLIAPLVALAALALVKVALGLTVVLTLAAWPLTAALLLAVSLAAWLLRRAR